jgi:hypothetical protein
VRLEALAEDPVAKETRAVCRAVFTMAAAEDGVAVPVRLHAGGGWAGGPPPAVAQSG